MKQQLVAMLDMQDAMNTKVHADWRAQHNAWYRAIWVECAELMDHYGWKWWKKQESDIAQVQLELIDIWHFGLSLKLQAGDQSHSVIAAELASELEFAVPSGLDFLTLVEKFALGCLRDQTFDASRFRQLMAASSLNFEALYCQYVGKNVLNFFRQDHGYQAGTYRKLWHGREDNQHLVEVLAELDHSRADFQDAIYAALKARYSAANSSC